MRIWLLSLVFLLAACQTPIKPETVTVTEYVYTTKDPLNLKDPVEPNINNEFTVKDCNGNLCMDIESGRILLGNMVEINRYIADLKDTINQYRKYYEE